jgi:hypothetical protein|tara:strand:- start:80 stop:667 length:588 start_codon:yes stop_codon:yes gene_type:complete
MIENNQPVVISRDESGNIIRVSKNNPEYGFVRVEQPTFAIAGGWVDDKTRSAIINGKLEKLQRMLPALEKNEKNLKGQIIITERFEPFFTNTEHPKYEQLRDKNLKIAGDTGVVLKGVDPETGEERPIYRKTEFTSDMNATDTFISHINSDEIRAAQAGTTTKEAKEDFMAAAEEADKEVEKEEEVEMEDETFEL